MLVAMPKALPRCSRPLRSINDLRGLTLCGAVLGLLLLAACGDERALPRERLDARTTLGWTDGAAGSPRDQGGVEARPDGGTCGADCEPFSLIVLPDTQYYTRRQAGGPQNTMVKQLQWVRDHRAAHNIRFVIHVGDITDNNVPAQWRTADEAFALLDQANVPYSVVPGNHDYFSAGAPFSRNNTLLDHYFPPSRFATQGWFGGAFAQSSANSYALFEAGPHKFLVLNLEYGPRKGPLCWADRVIAAHPDRRVVIVSHCVQTHGGTLAASCPSADYRVPGGSGATIWQELASRHSNVFLVLSGHVNDSEHTVLTGHNGNEVHFILTDYQSEEACTEASAAACTAHCQTGTPVGNGWMRELTFAPRQNRVYVRSFTVEEGNSAVFPGGVPAFFCGPPNREGRRFYATEPTAADHRFDFALNLSEPVRHARHEGGRAFTDFTVNTVEEGDHRRPVLIGAGGKFVALWEDDSSTADGPGNADVVMRGFEAGGCEAFGERRVSAASTGQQRAPAAGMAADGTFVVAWEDDSDGNGSSEVHARGFTARGAERFARLTVNTVGTGQQQQPAVAVAPDGRINVAWEDDRDRDGRMQIWLRGFAADGTQRFAERSIHADNVGTRRRPALAPLADGGCVVVWEDDGDGNGFSQIHARAFGPDGNERSARLVVNSAGRGQQRHPVVATDAGGGFAVAWEDDQDGDGAYRILVRGFEADGRQRFADRDVGEVAQGEQLLPALVLSAGGDFVLAWQDAAQAGGAPDIKTASFTATGAPATPAQGVNRVTAGPQRAPSLLLDPAGTLLIAWQDDMAESGRDQLLVRALGAPVP